LNLFSKIIDFLYVRFLIPRFRRDFADIYMTTPLYFGPTERAHIASSVKLNNTLLNLTSGCITIEDGVIFGHSVSLLTGTHETAADVTDRAKSPRYGRDIRICKHAWLASNSTVIGPVIIGRNAVVCAGAVVTKDVEPWTVVAGIPARKIRVISHEKATP
jgi:acetyltransferase-like isoleucine patch superfamily enzyme